MGNFTRDTFDKSKHYVGVRLQQGVPMVDADWMKLKIDTAPDGATMSLEIENRSAHDWPDISAVIPCFNPGSTRGNTDAKENILFLRALKEVVI